MCPRLPLTRRVVTAAGFLALLALASCERSDPAALSDAPATVPSSSSSSTTTTEPVVVVPYRVERRVNDGATATFESVVHATLADGRGWPRARFRMVPDPNAEYRVILAEGSEVDRLCAPYTTRSTYSCQLGPVVALNADRWRTATPLWTGDLASYRVMLVNHEFGHLLGQKHPDVQCPGSGQLAPVMAQQSTELGRCLPNPWPLDTEIERAARHDLPLAPPYER